MLHHEQNIWKMGGLRRRLPITFATFGAGALALIGCPPFSGFSVRMRFSRSPTNTTCRFSPCIVHRVLTAFYVIRMSSYGLLRYPRSDSASEGRESPPVMTMPLIVLAILATLGDLHFSLETYQAPPEKKQRSLFQCWLSSL